MVYIMKISILTFSKNNRRLLFRLIKNVRDIASEIVVIDSSSEKNYIEIKNKCKSISNKKLIKLYHYKSLGYVEPFRMIGISKCKNEFLLYLDSDEYINTKLKNYIKKLDLPEHICGLRINRITFNKKGKPINKIGYETRLFKREKVLYKGMIHEVPILSGPTIEAPISCKIYNIAYEVNTDPKKTTTIETIEAYTNRKSYFDVLNEKSIAVSLIRNIIMFKIVLLKINKNEELRKSDYILYSIFAKTISSVLYFILTYRKFNFGGVLNWIRYQNSTIKIFFSFPPEIRKLQFLISCDIRKNGGLINYLNLNERTLLRLNKSKIYSKYDGLNLLIKLLTDRLYKRGIYVNS